MSQSRKTRENAEISRKRAQNPHGPIKSLEKLSDEYDAQQGGETRSK